MNKRKFRMIYLILFIPFIIAFGDANHSAIDVSLINIIATPENYHGKMVRVIGVINIEFEGNEIYLSKEHFANSITKNALWISLNYKAIGKTETELSKYNGEYVLVEGVFNKDRKGHLGLCSGTIENITRFYPWPPEIVKTRKKNG